MKSAEIIKRTRKWIPIFIWPAVTSMLLGMDLRVGLSSADALERSGNQTAALELYETLYREHPSNPAVFARFKFFCLNQGLKERALKIVVDQKRLRPDDPTLDVDQGVILNQLGRRDEAFSVWQALIDRRPDQPAFYHLVGAAMIREGLLRETVGIYEQGEKHVKNPGMFDTQLADLFLKLKDYDKAADRILSGYLIRPDIRVLQDFFRLFPQTEPDLVNLARRVEKLNAPVERGIELNGLCLHLFLDSRFFKQAFRTARQIRDLSESKGRDALIVLGQSALDAKAWDWAEQSFREALTIPSNRDGETVAFWGLARTAEGRGDLEAALSQYTQFVQIQPRGEMTHRTWMRIGSILREKGKMEEAVQSFEKAAKAFPPSRIQAWIELGVCRIDQGEWDSAGVVFQKVIEDSKPGEANWIKGIRLAAETEYFAGRLDSSLSMLKRIDGLKSDSIALALPELNDALDFRIRLEGLSKNPESLKTLAKGEWLLRVRRHLEAKALLDSLARSDPDMEPIALLREADACSALGEFLQAATLLDRVWRDHPGSMEAEAALERSGQIFQELGDSGQALERFEILLERYPQSQRLGQVRERIRELRVKS